MLEGDVAVQRFLRGACVLVLDAPHAAGFEVGIDGCSWQVGERFQGLKMIPPGLHLLTYRLGDAPLTSIALFLASGSAAMFRWEAEGGRLVELAPAARQSINLLLAEPNLGPYPADELAHWPSLSSRITAEAVARSLPRCGAHTHAFDQTTPSAYTPDTGCPEAARFGFSPLELARSFPPSAVGRERTVLALDKSYLLRRRLQDERGWPGLAAELQLAFLVAAVGQNWEGFEHWKRIVGLLAQSHRAIPELPDVFVQFVGIVGGQLGSCAGGFWAELLAPDGGNVLETWLKAFVREGTQHGSAGLQAAVGSFARTMHSKFGWRLLPARDAEEEEGEEDGPVVVEL